MAKTEKLQPIHPGEILREDFMVQTPVRGSG